MAEDQAKKQAKRHHTAGAARGRTRWYAGYLVLSAINIVTIVSALLLNFQLAGQYRTLNEESRYWSRHLSDYARLEGLLAEVNAPGNNVFASLDPDGELARLDSALGATRKHIAAMRGNHEIGPAPAHLVDWPAVLGEIRERTELMGRQTKELLFLFDAGKVVDASREMASLDKTYAAIIEQVNELELETQHLQSISLDRQVTLTERMRNAQFFIGSLIAVLVIGVALYGHRQNRRMRLNDAKSERQLAALEASERRFRELTEGSIQGIAVHSDGIPLLVNDAWARIHGFGNADEARAVGNICDLIVPEDRDLVRDIQYALQHGVGNSRQYEYRARRRDGRVIWLECQERIVVWEGQSALQSTVIDVTERKEAEEGLRRAILEAERATSARTRFFAAASHDLRQPLHAISLYLPLLLKHMKQAEGREMLEAIQNSCSAMRSLLDSLLDISRLDAGVIDPQIGPVSLLDLFDRLGMEFIRQAEAKGLELRIVPADYWVESDAALLERILRNMLTNAIRYTQRGKILLGARRAGRSIRIEVWDTGIGIERQALQHVFEEFYQADNPERDRSRGLGLGLAIIKRLATLLGHEFGVRSWPGKGSVFDITLQATEEPAEEPDEWSTVQPATTIEGSVVLLIDDDPMVLEGTEAMLEDWGCRVLAAASASEAVGMVAESARQPDVVLADLRLRGSETGLDAVSAVNDVLSRPVPGIIVTGDTDPDRIKQVTESGLIVLHKPVEPARLKAALTRQLGKSAKTGQRDDLPRRAIT